ncbi:MAG: PaaI family thioesterase [Verrucomicrobiales bacterium]|nr:PaaI family thioesterase [Verrucomicrobiales bacterium]
MKVPVTASEAHPFCFACSASNPMGLALEFRGDPDGGVLATFLGHAALEGYPGVMHGGVVATLLDGAMTRCLFAHGVVAVTAELSIRYVHEVNTAEPLTVRAWRESQRHGCHQVAAEIRQGGRITTRARATFMPRHPGEPARPGGTAL